MSGYIRRTPFEVLFDGDKVTGFLTPLRKGDALRISALRREVTDDEGKKSNGIDRHEFMKLADEILPAYVEEFSGLTAADGSTVKLDEVVRDIYFAQLVVELAYKLVATGAPADPKALESLREGT